MYIEETVNTKFLGWQINNNINLKNHTEEIIAKLSTACYSIRSVVHINNINTLKSNYFVYSHSVIKYGIILSGNSFNNGKIFTLQKKIARLVVGVQPRTSCRNQFKQFLISNFRRVLNAVCFLLGYSPASEFYVPTFRNNLSVPSS